MKRDLTLCQRALLTYFVNYSASVSLWFWTGGKWEPAADYLTRLTLAGFDKSDESILAPMGIRKPWDQDDFLHGSIVFDIPDVVKNREHFRHNKKCAIVHDDCVEAGFKPLLILSSTSENSPIQIATTSETNGVIISGLWTTTEVPD